MLGALPRDATAALAAASGAAAAGGYGANDKVVVRWKAVAGAPPPPRPLAKISAGQRFDAVVAYLRRVLRVAETDSVFLYVNQAFAPALDEVVGNLHRVSMPCVVEGSRIGSVADEGECSASRTPRTSSSLPTPLRRRLDERPSHERLRYGIPNNRRGRRWKWGHTRLLNRKASLRLGRLFTLDGLEGTDSMIPKKC